MTKKQNLTLSTLKNKNKIYNETFEEQIDGFTVSIKKTWSPTKINELIIEFGENIRTMNVENQVQVSTAYIYLLLLRYFSSLSIPKELNKQLDWLNELIDSGYLDQLVKLLPIDQISIVEEEIKKATKNMKANLPVIQEELSKFEFENEEIENIALPSEKSE